MKKNAKNTLIGFTTRDGLTFQLEEDEEIIVDSFDFRARNSNINYLGFISNKRIIFKKASNILLSGTQGFSEITSPQIKFIYWADIKGIVYGNIWGTNLRILGKITDFTFAKKTQDWEMGSLHKGLGGLSYKNKKQLEEVLLPSLQKFSTEYKIPFGTSKKYNKFANISNEETKKILKEIRNKWLKMFLTLSAVLLGSGALIMATVILFTRGEKSNINNNNSQSYKEKNFNPSNANRYEEMLNAFKYSYFDYCKNIPINDLFENFMNKVTWDAYSDGYWEFVKITGDITYNYELAPVVLYFQITDFIPGNSIRFQLSQSLLNNQEMSNALEERFFSSMYNEFECLS